MLWVCLSCDTRYAWSLDACPHCGKKTRHEAGTPKPRKKKAGSG